MSATTTTTTTTSSNVTNSPHNNKKKNKPTMRQRLSSFKDSSTKKRLSGNGSATTTTTANAASIASKELQQQQQQQVAISEHDGIEVSLEVLNNSNKQEESREPQGSLERSKHTIESVIDVQELIRLRRKVYKKQFSVHFPALQQQQNSNALGATNASIRQHRVPLSGTKEQETSFLDALHLLQISGPKDEQAAVSNELKSLNKELNALEQDKTALEQKHQSATTSTSSTTTTSANDWDINRMLSVISSSNNSNKDKKKNDNNTLSMEERQKLQTKRGNNLTIHLSSNNNNKAKQALLSKFGAKVNSNSSNNNLVTIGPHNCKKPTTKELQHLALCAHHQHKNSTSNSKPGVVQTSFALSFDHNYNNNKGTTQTWGHLPLNLFRRIKYHDTLNAEDITYLSSGPLGSYFCEFANGESWWGSPIEDEDFFEILEEWSIHRVVFGPAQAIEDERNNNNVVLTHSWMVMAKDGKLAWKNLPSKLHNTLKHRKHPMAGLAEASLGPGNCYFCKFLDGTMEYCLPAHMALTCDQIEKKGGTITNVMFHPEISNDYVIRHTAITGNLL